MADRRNNLHDSTYQSTDSHANDGPSQEAQRVLSTSGLCPTKGPSVTPRIHPRVSLLARVGWSETDEEMVQKITLFLAAVVGIDSREKELLSTKPMKGKH